MEQIHERLNREPKNGRAVATTVIQREAKVEQLPWKLSGRFLEGEVNNSGDASIEQRTRFANVKRVAEPEQVGVKLVHQ
ncbi:hypothetical protein RSSM_01018 [Rhodopirellula sallentina SM41]|uniref:Uncharacterized protein n=1 Tax=Rhodopirellula sallentina SM41 TaxID=1263870 RepID=M5UI64_9BACT|nr:hypothetical protein RSSM_01018 [Rhodopirellula sallentina SM41]